VFDESGRAANVGLEESLQIVDEALTPAASLRLLRGGMG
jgi:hypothetical protein